MTLATKERIASRRQVSTDRFIRSTHPILYISMRRDGDQFLSDDATGYLCIATGAVWQLYNRSFDALNDTIRIATANALQTANGSLIAWVNSRTLANSLYVYSHNSDELSLFRTNLNSDYVLYYDSLAVFTMTGTSTAKEWVCIGVSFIQNGTGYGFENGVQITSGSCSATAPATAANAYIGSLADAGNYWRGEIGEILKYPRALMPREFQQIYLATKWRYI